MGRHRIGVRKPNAKTPLTGTTCTALGMTPNSNSGSVPADNWDLLSAAVVAGRMVLLDGVYYIGADATAIDTSKLVIVGTNPALHKLHISGGKCFNITGAAAGKGFALIRGIGIYGVAGEMPYIINCTATTSPLLSCVADITVEDCCIEGDIRLVHASFPQDFPFAETPCYIDNLNIINNEFYDVYNSGGSRSIIYVNDTPVKMATIKHNRVINFSYRFYINGITNESAATAYIHANNNAVIEHNHVVCTDDYDAYTKNGNAHDIYYLFALVEGQSVVCRHNYFEGFHVFDAAGTVCYDNYFSVSSLDYQYNIWRNIVNFTAGITYVDIMKSKATDGINSTRIYKNNKYIVEVSYADRFGKDRFLLRKRINTYQTIIGDIIIEDNHFDMYILSFFHGGLAYYYNAYKFNRNTVLMDTMEHITRQALVVISDMQDGDGNFVSRTVEVNDNIIIADIPAFGDGVGTQKFYLIMPYWGGGVKSKVNAGDKTSVVMTGNIITVDDGIVYTSEAAEIAKFVDSLGTVDISGNTITVLS